MTDRNSFPMPFLIPAEDAAKAIVAGIEKDKAEIVFPLPMAVLMKAARLVPVRAWTAATAAMTRRGMRQEIDGPRQESPSSPEGTRT